MKINEKSKKIISKVILLGVILIFFALLVKFAWAKYISFTNGNAEADIAQWNFNVTAGSRQDLIIDLAKTRYDEDTNSVDRTTVAPGTSGKIILNINANVTDVSLKYDIDLDIQQIPENLIFYTDPGMENAIYYSNNNIHMDGFFRCNENNKTVQKILYWKWSMETGQTAEQISINDELDSRYIGKNITMAIQVVGSQVKEVPNTEDIQVTFDANGGTISGYGNSEKMTKVYTNSETYGELPVPIREGYTFAGWSEKNLLNLKGRTFRNPGGQYEDTEKRNFTGNGIYVGIAWNNFYNPIYVEHYEIDYENNSIAVSSKFGFGVGVDYKVEPNTEYTVSISELSTYPRIMLGQYREDGSIINYGSASDTSYTITTDKEVCWLLFVISGDVSVEDRAFYNIQIEKGAQATEFCKYEEIVSSTSIYTGVNHTLTARWIKE